MKQRSVLLLKLLHEKGSSTGTQLSAALNLSPPSIKGPLQLLLDEGFISAEGDRYKLYALTDSGRTYLTSDECGRRLAGVENTLAAANGEVLIGVFTSGDLHIEANGRKLVLSPPQTRQLVDFLDSVPERLFTGEARPTMASLPSRVVRHD